MTVRMFRLEPGASLRYQVRPVGGRARPQLSLLVLRPDEGPSTELELCVSGVDPSGAVVADRGRVPLDKGYLAVVLEVRRQIEGLGIWGGDQEFDLVLDAVREDGEQRAAGV